MAGRRTNLALLALLAAALVTGTLAFAVGTPVGRWLVLAHGVAGIGIVVLAPWKSVIARRGVRRRRSGRRWSLALSVLAVVALATGIAHAGGLRGLPLGVTVMQLHVGAALATLPLAAWHVVARPARPRATDLNRRNALRTGALVGAATVGYFGVEATWRVTGAGGARRRFTGSHEVGSFEPQAMPVTQWLFDDVPRLDGRGSTTLTLGGSTWDLARLASYDDRVTTVIDCTGGWYARQQWAGARLDRLFDHPSTAASVVVRSVTGYTRRFPVVDLPRLLLATRVGGQPLSPGHGYPARLVAPGRRGSGG